MSRSTRSTSPLRFDAVPALTPEMLIEAYRQGIFPMADSYGRRTIRWYAPDPRAVLPLDTFHVPKNVGKLYRQQRFELTTDRAFGDVIRACSDREETWISSGIIEAYTTMHRLGMAHSVECWLDGELAGGLYGVHLGGAFFGESMFHRARDSSKIALVHLVQRLRAGGFTLLDIQMVTPTTLQFGAVEIPRKEYVARLNAALPVQAIWPPDPPTGSEA